LLELCWLGDFREKVGLASFYVFTSKTVEFYAACSAAYPAQLQALV